MATAPIAKVKSVSPQQLLTDAQRAAAFHDPNIGDAGVRAACWSPISLSAFPPPCANFLPLPRFSPPHPPLLLPSDPISPIYAHSHHLFPLRQFTRRAGQSLRHRLHQLAAAMEAHRSNNTPLRTDLSTGATTQTTSGSAAVERGEAAAAAAEAVAAQAVMAVPAPSQGMAAVSAAAVAAVRISTFHSFCLQTLRQFAHLAGLPKDFTVFPPKMQVSASLVHAFAVDEFQDTDSCQMELLLLLCRPLPSAPTLTLVADDDQQIYSFRGAMGLPNLRRFLRTYPQARTVCLDQNFRSCGSVVEAARHVIAHNQWRHAKWMVTAAPVGPLVSLCECRTERCEAAAVVGKICQLVGSCGVPANQIAILYRVQAVGKVIRQYLKSHGIKVSTAATGGGGAGSFGNGGGGGGAAGGGEWGAAEEDGVAVAANGFIAEGGNSAMAGGARGGRGTGTVGAVFHDILALLRLAANESDDVACRQVLRFVCPPPTRQVAVCLRTLQCAPHRISLLPAARMTRLHLLGISRCAALSSVPSTNPGSATNGSAGNSSAYNGSHSTHAQNAADPAWPHTLSPDDMEVLEGIRKMAAAVSELQGLLGIPPPGWSSTPASASSTPLSASASFASAVASRPPASRRRGSAAGIMGLGGGGSPLPAFFQGEGGGEEEGDGVSCEALVRPGGSSESKQGSKRPSYADLLLQREGVVGMVGGTGTAQGMGLARWSNAAGTSSARQAEFERRMGEQGEVGLHDTNAGTGGYIRGDGKYGEHGNGEGEVEREGEEEDGEEGEVVVQFVDRVMERVHERELGVGVEDGLGVVGDGAGEREGGGERGGRRAGREGEGKGRGSGGSGGSRGRESEQDNGGVVLSTIHQAKGLEWQAVIVVRVNEGVLPLVDFSRVTQAPATASTTNYSPTPQTLPPTTPTTTAEAATAAAGGGVLGGREGCGRESGVRPLPPLPSMPPDYDAQMEEERRLMYVALTRAQQHLMVTHVMSAGGQPMLPSRFLAELPPAAVHRTTQYDERPTNHVQQFVSQPSQFSS
ncbi:unnamed protein product [Closterium sp. Yama58-4]|nr:unnamed protein product [Closterium sp. Yama58-4]